MATPVRLRAGAAHDIDDAIAYWQREADEIDAWRVLHARRDLAGTVTDSR